MRLGLRIAKRFLRSNLGQTFLIVLGIAIGVSVQVFIGSLIQGLQKSLVEKTIGNSSQITISSNTDEKRIEGYEDLLESIKLLNPEIENISIANDNAAFLEVEDNSQSLLVRGFEMEEADKLYNILDRLEEGTYPQEDNEIILGIDLKEEYNLELMDSVSITTTNQKTIDCVVVGFFDLEVASINKNWGITTFETSKNMFETGDTITGIEIQVNEDSAFIADEIATHIVDQLKDPSLEVDNWKAQNEQLLSGLQGQSLSSILIQVFVMVSVVLGIASVLAVTVMQKSRQIGILKAMGIKNSTTSYIFLFEGIMLGVFGAILGVALGLLLALSFTVFAVNADGTPVVALYISSNFILLSGGIAVVASVLAALIPAIKSSKLNPIDIIRNN